MLRAGLHASPSCGRSELPIDQMHLLQITGILRAIASAQAKEKSCESLIADRVYGLNIRESHSPVKCSNMHSLQYEAVGEPRLLQLRLGCERRIDPNWKPEFMVQKSRDA